MNESIKNGYLVPQGDERWRDLPPQLEKMRMEYSAFLETAGSGHIDLYALNKWAQNAKDYNLASDTLDRNNPLSPIL